MLCFIQISLGDSVNEEKNSVSRIVGNTPHDLLQQLNRESIEVSHASYFGEVKIFDTTRDVLNKQYYNTSFEGNQFPDYYFNVWGKGTIDNYMNSFEHSELFILKSNLVSWSDQSLFDNGLYFTTSVLTTVRPQDLKNWENTFARTNPLFLFDTQYAGISIPKTDTFVTQMAKDSVIIAPTFIRSSSFSDSLVCSAGLTHTDTIGDLYNRARNFYYKSETEDFDIPPGIALESYHLYGNPAQKIQFEGWNAELNKNICKNFLENLAVGIQYLGQDGNYSKFRKLVSFQITNYSLHNVKNYSILLTDSTFNEEKFGELVLPSAIRTTHFPLQTLITNFSVSGIGGGVDLVIPSFASYYSDYENNTCYTDRINYSIDFEQSYTQDAMDFIARIRPLEVINCTSGAFRLFTSFNYTIDYIAISPAHIVSVSYPVAVTSGELINVSVELMPLTVTPQNISLAIFDESNNLILQSETQTNITNHTLAFFAPSDEGLKKYSLELMTGNETQSYRDLYIAVEFLKASADIPPSLALNQNISIDLLSESNATIELSGHYAVLTNNTLLKEDSFSMNITKGSNIISVNNSLKSQTGFEQDSETQGGFFSATGIINGMSAYDENWETAAYGTGGGNCGQVGYIYENFTIISPAQSALWLGKYGFNENVTTSAHVPIVESESGKIQFRTAVYWDDNCRGILVVGPAGIKNCSTQYYDGFAWQQLDCPVTLSDINLKVKNYYEGKIGWTLSKTLSNLNTSSGAPPNVTVLNLPQLTRENQHYDFIIDLLYANQKKTLNYFLATNNLPNLFTTAKETYTPAEIVAINYSVWDDDNDTVIVSVNNSNFIKENNSFIWNQPTKNLGEYDVLVTAFDGFGSAQKIVSFTIHTLSVDTGEELFAIKAKNKKIMSIDSFGNLILSGGIYQMSGRVKNATDPFTVKMNGNNVLIMDLAGNLYIDGILYPSHSEYLLSDSNSGFIVKDSQKNIVASVNQSGDFVLKGTLIEYGNP